jgi:hypothetical protein
MSAETVLEKIRRMRAAAEPSSEALKKAFYRIGTVLQTEMRLTALRKGVKDQSHLIDSINYRIDGDTLQVGSWGIKYATRNEFGGAMTHAQVAGMFYWMRQAGKAKRAGKGVVTVNKDGTGYWQPRPFIRDSLQKRKDFIIERLREAMSAK